MAANISNVITSNISTIVSNTTVPTHTVFSSAYEWRFIIPPYIVIFMLSITGNCMVIATLASNRKMRSVTNVYLLNLAISDFLLGVFCLPFTLVGQVYRRFLFGAAMCKFVPFLQAVAVTVDVWTMVAISLERYFAICRPLKSRRWQTLCHAYKMITIVWSLSLLFNSPILIVSELQKMRGNAFKCREAWQTLELERLFNISLDVALLVIPFFILMIAYALIVVKLWRGMKHEIELNVHWQNLSRRPSCNNCQLTTSFPENRSPDNNTNRNRIAMNNMEGDQGEEYDTNVARSNCIHTSLELDFRQAVRSTNTNKSIEAKRKVIRMLFVIVSAFFICWTPLHVINTIYLFYPDELYQYIGPKGIVLLQLLAYCTSCCNPITYCFMNRKFRQAFLNLFRSCWIFRCCDTPASESTNQVTPLPSSQELTNCAVQGSRTSARTDLEEREDCV